MNDDDVGTGTAQTTQITVNPENDAPTAQDFTGANRFKTFTNVGLEAGGTAFADKLAALTDARNLEQGATDPDSLPAGFTIAVENKATTLGGNVQIFASGSFFVHAAGGRYRNGFVHLHAQRRQRWLGHGQR